MWFCCLLIVCSFCWHPQFNSVLIAPLLLLFFIDTHLITRLKAAFSQRFVWLNFIFVALVAVGLLYTQDVHGGTNTFVRKLTLLIFPIIFCSHLFFNQRSVALLMNFFCISCLGALLYCEVNGVIKYFEQNGNMHWLIYELLASPIMHPGYFSNFYCVAVWWLVQPWLRGQQQGDFTTTMRVVLLIVFIIFIGLLTSKTAFLTLVAFTGIFLLIVLTQKLSLRHKIIAAVSSLSAIIIVLLIVKFFLWARFTGGGMEAITNPDANPRFDNSVGSRAIAVREGFNLVLQQPFFGHGTGMANPVLLQRLNDKKFTDLVAHDMHTHNQVIHTMLDVGFVGIAALLALGIYAFLFFKKYKNYFGIGIVALAAINFVTDDMLEIQAGVVPFAFFTAMAFSYQVALNKDNVSAMA
jgi:O-antigen ligase